MFPDYSLTSRVPPGFIETYRRIKPVPAPSTTFLRVSPVKENKPFEPNQTSTTDDHSKSSIPSTNSPRKPWTQYQGPLVAQARFWPRRVPLEAYGLLPAPLPNMSTEHDRPQTIYYERVIPTFPKRYCSDPTYLTTSNLRNMGNKKVAILNRQQKNVGDHTVSQPEVKSSIQANVPSRPRSRSPEPPSVPIGRKEKQKRVRPPVTRMDPPEIGLLWRNKAAASGIRISIPEKPAELKKVSVQNTQNVSKNPSIRDDPSKQDKDIRSEQIDYEAQHATTRTRWVNKQRFLAHDWGHYDWMRDVLAFRITHIKARCWRWEMIIPPYLRLELSNYKNGQLKSAYDIARDTYLKYKEHAARFNIRLVGDNEHVWLIAPDEAEIKFAMLYYPAIMEYCESISHSRGAESRLCKGKPDRSYGCDEGRRTTYEPETTCVDDIKEIPTKRSTVSAPICVTKVEIPVELNEARKTDLFPDGKNLETIPLERSVILEEINANVYTAKGPKDANGDLQKSDHVCMDEIKGNAVDGAETKPGENNLSPIPLERGTDDEITLPNISAKTISKDDEIPPQTLPTTNGPNEVDTDGDAHESEDEKSAPAVSDGEEPNENEEPGLDPTWSAAKRKKWRRQQRKRAQAASVTPVAEETESTQLEEGSEDSESTISEAAVEQLSGVLSQDVQESNDQTPIQQFNEADSSGEQSTVGESPEDVLEESLTDNQESGRSRPSKRKKAKGKKKKPQPVVFTDDGFNLSRSRADPGSPDFCRAALLDRDYHLKKGTWHNYQIMPTTDLNQRRCYVGEAKIMEQKRIAQEQLNMWDHRGGQVSHTELLLTSTRNISDYVIKIKWHVLYYSAVIQLCNEQLGIFPDDPSLRPLVRDSGSDESFSHRDDLVPYFRNFLKRREELKPSVDWHDYHAIFRFRLLAISMYSQIELHNTREWAVNKLMVEDLGDEQDPSLITYRGTASTMSALQVKRIYGMIYWNACIKLVDLMLDESPAIPIEDGPEKIKKERWAKEEWPHVPLPKMRGILQKYREAIIHENDLYVRIIDNEEGERIGLLKSNVEERHFSRKLAAEKLRYWAEKGGNPASTHDKNAEEVKANYYWLRALDFIMLCDRLDEYVRLERQKIKGKQRADPPDMDNSSDQSDAPEPSEYESTKILSPLIRPEIPDNAPTPSKEQQDLEVIGQQIKYCQQSLTTLVQRNSVNDAKRTNKDMANEQRMMDLLKAKIAYLRAKLSTLTEEKKDESDDDWVVIGGPKKEAVSPASEHAEDGDDSGKSSPNHAEDAGESSSRSGASNGGELGWTMVGSSIPMPRSRCSRSHLAEDVPESLRYSTPPPARKLRFQVPVYWYVDEILEVEKRKYGETWYFVSWWGYLSIEECTWERAEYLVKCENAMKRFWEEKERENGRDDLDFF